jgi:hypothetical protein
MSLTTLLGWTGATIGGSLGWWAGASGGMFVAFLMSMVGIGLGLYLGRQLGDRLLG